MNKANPTGLQSAWTALQKAKFQPEEAGVKALLADYPLKASAQVSVVEAAGKIVETSRAMKEERGTLDAFMQEFGLSNQEGVALMCLAEALLRIPDAETQDLLISEKMKGGNWKEHAGKSDDFLVNASVWGLMLTGGVVKLDKALVKNPVEWIGKTVSRLGEPVIRTAVMQAMKIMGRQFVFGRDMKEALKRRSERKQNERLFSFDMLGEGARTAEAASRYQRLYLDSITAVGEKTGEEGTAHQERSSISIKLSALHPRYEFTHRERVMAELFPRIKELALKARSYGIGLTIDAEEADRLELSLELLEALARDKDLQPWQGLGLAVQAYMKRAPYVIDWLAELAQETGRRFPVRLVKGAYWDSEIKHAQELGYPDYPVWTRKATTDVCYLATAKKMLDAPKAFYPQFASHNAHTIAAIAEMAGNTEFEFQRLHGMGDLLYRAVAKALGRDFRVRTYAPVGAHEDLLPYLVRRLLENGANSSFVNRFMDTRVLVADVTQDPAGLVSAFDHVRHAAIPLPRDIYGDRKNSAGIDLTSPLTSEAFLAELAQQSKTVYDGPSLIAGQAVKGKPIEVTSPQDPKKVVGRTREASEGDMKQAIEIASKAQPAWDALGGEKRAEIFERAADLIEERRVTFIDLMTREAGKNLPDGISEMREAADYCRYYALQARKKFAHPEVLKGPTGEQNSISLHGRGVFLCIAPWNFPLAIFLGQIVAALAAGNAVLSKPAGQTPLIAATAVRLLFEAGVPKEVLHLIIAGGSTVGKVLVADKRTAGVALTGSTWTAKVIHKTLAEKDGPVVPLIAETGGQNAMIVDSSALPEQVTDDVMTSAFSSAGQRCSALRVLFVQDSIADKVIAMLKGVLAERKVGDPAELSTDCGPVIDGAARKELEAHARRMMKEGKLVAKGVPPKGLKDGEFFVPHIFEIPDLSILEDEVFGPILHVIRYNPKNLPDVLSQIAGTEYGLTFGVHSRIESRWLELFAKTNIGNTYVNRNMIGAVVGVQPFGGQCLSGTGPKAGGPHYLLRFATEKTLTINTAAIGGNTDLFSMEEG